MALDPEQLHRAYDQVSELLELTQGGHTDEARVNWHVLSACRAILHSAEMAARHPDLHPNGWPAH